MSRLPKRRYLPAGESALVVEFGATIDPAIHDAVVALDAALARASLPGVIETVPTYRSVMVHFEPRVVTTEELIFAIEALDIGGEGRTGAALWHVPVCYDPPYAADLLEVASILCLAPEDIVELHRGAAYRVYMIGFAPGFTFLGGLPEALAISRRTTPRPPVPPGALLIAGGQALIATCPMPTGWYEIGRTPARFFDFGRERPSLAEIGDQIRFERIDPATFEALAAAAEAGEAVARREPLG